MSNIYNNVEYASMRLCHLWTVEGWAEGKGSRLAGKRYSTPYFIIIDQKGKWRIAPGVTPSNVVNYIMRTPEGQTVVKREDLMLAKMRKLMSIDYLEFFTHYMLVNLVENKSRVNGHYVPIPSVVNTPFINVVYIIRSDVAPAGITGDATPSHRLRVRMVYENEWARPARGPHPNDMVVAVDNDNAFDKKHNYAVLMHKDVRQYVTDYPRSVVPFLVITHGYSEPGETKEFGRHATCMFIVKNGEHPQYEYWDWNGLGDASTKPYYIAAFKASKKIIDDRLSEGSTEASPWVNGLGNLSISSRFGITNEAERGACIIASYVFMYLRSLNRDIDTATLNQELHSLLSHMEKAGMQPKELQRLWCLWVYHIYEGVIKPNILDASLQGSKTAQLDFMQRRISSQYQSVVKEIVQTPSKHPDEYADRRAAARQPPVKWDV